MTIDELRALLAKVPNLQAHAGPHGSVSLTCDPVPGTAYADVAFAAAAIVNAAPLLLEVVDRAKAMHEALHDSRFDQPRPFEEHTARYHLSKALTALDGDR
jgi:hypothetical protein